MTPALTLAVAAGGLIGAPARYLLDRWLSAKRPSDLPWGTLSINLSGALLLGFLQGLLLAGDLPAGAKAFAATGFCGAYTTFSTFAFENLSLIENGRLRLAGLYVLLSIGGGLAFAGAGLAAGIAL